MTSKDAVERLSKYNNHYVKDKEYLLIDAESEEWKAILKDLERLEQIDNAKPSEALECLEEIRERFSDDSKGNNSWGFKISQELDTIKQALLRAQEQEEELGCPLEVREQAFKKGFYDENGDHYFCEHYVPFLKQMHTNGIMKGEEKRFNIEDYKKTWWLRKDKSE